MDRELQVVLLKRCLLQEVSSFCSNDGRRWKESATGTLRLLRETGSKSVFFGGTLRSLLTSRIYLKRPGRPRDIDLVVANTEMECLRRRFQDSISRETRFGGLQLQRGNWNFDVWPLDSTWAFVNDGVKTPQLELLPTTTFFNLEAIAVETWSQPGKPRKMYAGDDQFFHGILDRTLEINRQHNPFPDLCVLRALLTASALDFGIGSRLARYIATHGNEVSSECFESLQRKHYGHIRMTGQELIGLVNYVVESLGNDDSTDKIQLPKVRQLWLWKQHM